MSQPDQRLAVEFTRPEPEEEFFSERRVLLLAGVIGAAIGLGGLLPRKANVLGVELGEFHPRPLAIFGLFIVAFLLIVFAVYAYADWRRWRWRVADTAYLRLRDVFNDLQQLKFSSQRTPALPPKAAALWAFRWRCIRDNDATIAKALHDILPPFIAGFAGLIFLASFATELEEPAAQIVTIISSPDGSSKSPVLIFSGPFLSPKGLEESSISPIATLAIPFGPGKCSSQPWEGYLNRDHSNLSQGFGRGLTECSTDKRPVKLRVRGFADSSEVKSYGHCNGANTSDEANLIIANKRAERIAQLISTAAREGMSGRVGRVCEHDAKGCDIIIEVFQWRNSPAMVTERTKRFQEGWPQYDLDIGQFNRRVEIEVVDTGACKVGMQ